MADRPVALVTGGTRGIGLAITERLLADGWAVMATYRSDQRAAAVVAASHDHVAVTAADVASSADCGRVVDDAVERFGGLDHVVCAAAITGDGLVRELSDDVWNATLATNLTGTFFTVRAALDHLTASGRGRIVLISSIAATMGSAGRAAYAASKAGLLGFAKTLAHEVAATGTTVNIVIPGPTADTGMAAGDTAEYRAKLARRIPVQRYGRAEETAHIVRALLDDRGGFTTGAAIPVDGGLSM